MLMEHLENPSNVNEKEIMLEQKDVTVTEMKMIILHPKNQSKKITVKFYLITKSKLMHEDKNDTFISK